MNECISDSSPTRKYYAVHELFPAELPSLPGVILAFPPLLWTSRNDIDFFQLSCCSGGRGGAREGEYLAVLSEALAVLPAHLLEHLRGEVVLLRLDFHLRAGWEPLPEKCAKRGCRCNVSEESLSRSGIAARSSSMSLRLPGLSPCRLPRPDGRPCAHLLAWPWRLEQEHPKTNTRKVSKPP